MIHRQLGNLAREGQHLTETRLPDGRLLRTDHELTVKGLPGRYWWDGTLGRDGSLTLYGGQPGHYQFRAVMPARVTTVHRKSKMRKGTT